MPSSEAFEAVEVVGLDADDTLWHSENRFRHAHEDYRHLLAPFVDVDDDALDRAMLATERRNLSLFGYGVKGFVLSLIETAIEVTDGAIDAPTVHRIIELGKDILQHPVELLSGVEETVESLLDAGLRLALITKGDLLHQESKIAASGLGDRMHSVDVVTEKTPSTYARVLDGHGVPPERFCMVGNSVRSDVLPALELGAHAVLVPYEYLWEHEAAEVPSGRDRFRRVERISAVPGLLGC